LAAREALSRAILEACAAAHVTPQQIKRTCIGVAGAARPQIAAVTRRLLGEIVSGEIDVAGDMVIALEAAFGGEPGVIVIAGTGSIAYGANAEARTARAGGWGFAISDEGSGHWIGRAAMAAVMRARDEDEAAAESSRLLDGILKCWSLRDIEELVVAANASPQPNFAGLFPAVLAAAEEGDSTALEVLGRAGVELAGLAGVVVRRLFADEDAVRVAMSGGVFANSARVREAFGQALRKQYSVAGVKREMVDAVHGALARARRGGTI
jgi:N-acetylglucosamine kinase-like BadF-type ATPase